MSFFRSVLSSLFFPKLFNPLNNVLFSLKSLSPLTQPKKIEFKYLYVLFLFPKERTDVACLNVLFSWCDTILMNPWAMIYLKQMKYDVQVFDVNCFYMYITKFIQEENPTENSSFFESNKYKCYFWSNV